MANRLVSAIGVMGGVLMGLNPALGGIDVTIPGSAADYHITLPEGVAPINTANGIGMDGMRLGVFGEARFAPMGRQNAERRAIVEFDLAVLEGFGDTVTAANFSIFLPTQASGVPNRDLDLYGATMGRASLLAFDGAGAADEFDAAGYTLLAPSFLSGITPPDYDMRFATDVTGYLSARYTEYLADSSKRYLYFRMQVQNNDESANAFYEISAGESAEPPRLEVTVVPGPGVCGVVICGVALGLGRRRRGWGGEQVKR